MSDIAPSWTRIEGLPVPGAQVEDMYRPDRFGRTATGIVEIAAK